VAIVGSSNITDKLCPKAIYRTRRRLSASFVP
jgi:hypothetical protein